MTDLITIIIPVYNLEKYIDECVISIQNQSVQTEYEILLIDDGSDDNSASICDRYAAEDKRIRVIHKLNGGLSDARNCGIENAKGNILCFVDGDDFVSEDYLKDLYDLLKSTGSDMAECGNILYYEGDEIKTQNAGKTKIISPKEWLTETNLRDFYSCVAWNKLYKRCLFDDIRYPIDRLYEDEATTYKLVYNSNHVARTYKKLYYYRQRLGSIVNSTKNEKNWNDSELAMRERCNFFHERQEKTLAAFAEAKYCLERISFCKANMSMSDKKPLIESAYNEIDSRYRKWIVSSNSVPMKYKLYIGSFLLFKRNLRSAG